VVTSENICQNCGFLCQHKIKLTDEEFDLLNKNRVEVQFEKGETIIKQGTFADHIVILQEGLLKKVIQSNNQRNIIIKINVPGDYIGLQTLGTNTPYPFSTIAIKKSKVCIVRQEIIKEVFDRNKDFQNYLLSYFSDDYLFTYNMLLLIGTKQMHGRLAETLIYLSDKVFQDEHIYHHLTRKEIAELAGMSVESMTKVFNEFKNDLLIDVKGKDIMLGDLKLLGKLIEYS